MPLRFRVPERGLADLPLCAAGLPQDLRDGVCVSYSSIALRVAARDVGAALKALRAGGRDLAVVRAGRLRFPPVSAATRAWREGGGSGDVPGSPKEEGPSEAPGARPGDRGECPASGPQDSSDVSREQGSLEDFRDILINAEELGASGASEVPPQADQRDGQREEQGAPVGAPDPLLSAGGLSAASSLALSDAFHATPAAAALRQAGVSYSLVPAERALPYERLPRQLLLELLLAAAARERGEPAPPPPTAFETIGHIAHYNLRAQHLPYRFLIGAVTLDAEGAIRTVVTKPEAITGVFRACPLELIAGEPDYVAEVHQGGLRFRLDFSTVYWNSRLGEEHERVCAAVAQRVREAEGLTLAGSEARVAAAEDAAARASVAHSVPVDSQNPVWVLDATGGVGPFAISLAASHGVRHIVCNDLNPEAYRWMQENVRINGCERQVECRNDDAKVLLKELLPARRVGAVLLNLPEMSIEFLGSAGEVLGEIRRFLAPWRETRSDLARGVDPRSVPADACDSSNSPSPSRSPDNLPAGVFPWFYVECFSSEGDAEGDILLRAMAQIYPSVGRWLASRGARPSAEEIRAAADLAFAGTQAVRRVRMVSASKFYCCLEFRLTWLDEGRLLGALQTLLGGKAADGAPEAQEPLSKRAS